MNLLHTILTDIKSIDIFNLSLFIICFYIFHFYYRHFTRVNPLPGPIPIPLIGSFAIFKEDIDAWFYELNKTYKHDGVYELNIVGNRQIVITRAEHISKFLAPSTSNNNMPHIMRTANNGLLNLFDLDQKGVGLNHDYKFWKFNRQIFSQAIMGASFSNETTRLINDLFEEMAGCWINLIQQDDDATIIDAAAWMRRFTNDFISVLTTGKRTFAIDFYYRKLKNEVATKEMIESEKFVESISTFFEDNQIIFVPKILRGLPLIGGRVDKMLGNSDYIYGTLVERIRERRNEIKKTVNSSNFDVKQLRNDLLTSMIVANTPYDIHPQKKNVDSSLLRPMTDDEVRGIMFDAFAAGTDTTSNTFCFVLYYISHHPNVKKKLLEEIESVFKDDPTRPVTLNDLRKLKYCEAIIKETSRIRPTVSMVSRYTSQPDEIAGYKWPSNILFIMYVRGINTNPFYWEDPEKFIPERFYEPQEIKKQQRHSFSMFGGGSRMCLGRKVAMVEMKILLASLYRKFDVELADMKAPLDVLTSTVTLCKKLHIKVIPR